MTITSLGGIGGSFFTPIINYPEVAILGVGRAEKKQVFIDGNFVTRTMLPLSLSYDHRIIDGAEAARFNNELKVTFKMLGVFDKKYKIANVIPIICPIIKPNEPIFRKPKDAWIKDIPIAFNETAKVIILKSFTLTFNWLKTLNVPIKKNKTGRRKI